MKDQLKVTRPTGVTTNKMKEVNSDGEMSFTEFKNLLTQLRTRPELLTLFQTVSKGNDTISPEDFLDFLRNLQVNNFFHFL